MCNCNKVKNPEHDLEGSCEHWSRSGTISLRVGRYREIKEALSRFISMEKQQRSGSRRRYEYRLVYYTNSGSNPIPGELKLFPRFLSCRLHYFRL